MKLFDFLKRHSFTVFAFGILLLASILRFYSYQNRWGLAFDQAHDAIIAKYALETHRLPLLGPYSSAGPFQTGGEWYWFIMLGIILIPAKILGPWIFLTLCEVFFVLGIIFFGRKLVGNTFGLIVGLLVAVSPVEIDQSINLTNQSPINLFSLLAVLSCILYSKTKNNWYLFILGLSASIAVTIHLQGVALITLVIAAILILPVKNVRSLAIIFFGLLLPMAPIFIADAQAHFTNTRHILQYYMHDQYKIPLDQFGRNWKNYTFDFWPGTIGNIFGVNRIISFFLIILSCLAIAFKIARKELSRVWVVLIASSIGFFLMLRYVHTPLFDSYIMFAHPFLFPIVTLGIYSVFSYKKILGIILIGVLIVFPLSKDINNIKNATNDTAKKADYWSDFLSEKYPGKKFLIYDYKNKSGAYTYPLLIYMERKNLVDVNGYKVGFGRPLYKDDPVNYNVLKEITGNKMGFVFIDLQSSSSAQLARTKWYPILSRYIYESQEEWYKNK